MNRVIVRLILAGVVLGAGILFGWYLRGVESNRQAQEIRLAAEFDRIATHTFNLRLIAANRDEKAKNLSEQRLFEALHRADQLVRSRPEVGLDIAVPNLTEAIGDAAIYAKSNAAPKETVEEAERLHAWIRAQNRPAT